MDEKDIESLKEKLKKKLENFEIDKKIGQFSVDSIYSMFPTESKILLKYIENIEKENRKLKQNIKKIKKRISEIDFDKYVYTKTALKYEQQELLRLTKQVRN